MTQRIAGLVSLLLLFTGSSRGYAQPADGFRFGISFSEEQSRDALDGRLLLLVSSDGSSEPRFQISTGPETGLVFGIDVEGLQRMLGRLSRPHRFSPLSARQYL